ncbi:MAG: hypothetical protein ACR2L2_17625 [Acidobacteriota bacterium]
MSVSQRDYEQIIQKQSAGVLTILIDVSAWRQLLVKIDDTTLAALAGRPVSRSLAVIRILSVSDLPMLLVAAALAIPAFGWWSLGVAPLTVFAGLAYKSRASIGRQRVVFVATLFILAVGLTIFQPWSFWLRAYILVLAMAFLLIRLLYVITNVFVFRLIYASYEFFNRFYLQPEGALLPLIWTQPEYSGETSVA